MLGTETVWSGIAIPVHVEANTMYWEQTMWSANSLSDQLTRCRRVTLEKYRDARLLEQFSAFCGTRTLLCCPQWPATFPWPAQFRHSHSAYLRSELILPFRLCLVLPSSLVPSRFLRHDGTNLLQFGAAIWYWYVQLYGTGTSSWRTRRRLSVFSNKSYLVDNILVFVQRHLSTSLTVGLHIDILC
jgi:hypothetical protein